VNVAQKREGSSPGTRDGQSTRDGTRDALWRTSLIVSVAAGLIVALIIGLVGVGYAKGRPVEYQATSSIVLLPAANLDEAGNISALDTLSRGQVVETFSQVLAGADLVGPAVEALAADGRDVSGVSVTFKPVGNTSIIDIVVTAPSAFVAEQVASSIAVASANVKTSLQPLFQAHVVSRGSGSATRTGAKPSAFILAFLIAALAAGIVTQQVVMRVLSSGRIPLPRISLPSLQQKTTTSTSEATATAARAMAGADGRAPTPRRAPPASSSAPPPADGGESKDSPATAKPKGPAGPVQEAQRPRPARSKTVEPSPEKS
jgi:capsular polysaccharide biosynthesis protein